MAAQIESSSLPARASVDDPFVRRNTANEDSAIDTEFVKSWSSERLPLPSVRLRHRPVVERLAQGLLVDASLAGNFAERAAGGRRRQRQLRVVLGVLAVGFDALDTLFVEETRSGG